MAGPLYPEEFSAFSYRDVSASASDGKYSGSFSSCEVDPFCSVSCSSSASSTSVLSSLHSHSAHSNFQTAVRLSISIETRRDSECLVTG